MITATKEFVWDSAHMLEGHLGLCKNVHGHTYKMQVEVAHSDGVIRTGPSEGMVMDFKDLKELVNRELIEPMDHAFITSGLCTPQELEITELLRKLGLKVYDLGVRPTAENMAHQFAATLQRAINREFWNLRLISVTVWETPTSFAKYVV